MTQITLLALDGTQGLAVQLACREKGIDHALFTKKNGTIPPAYKHIDLAKHKLILIDRQLVVINPAIMLEFVDERYPAPPMMPIDPIARAQARLMIDHFYAGWTNPTHGELHGLDLALTRTPFLLGEELSLVDLVLFERLSLALHNAALSLKSHPSLQRYFALLNDRYTPPNPPAKSATPPE